MFIADFGLAKQKQTDCSKMTSVVGTILYSCPEVVQSEPYGEKSDVWAIGCILYQMCTLMPPFYGNNMLSLVTKVKHYGISILQNLEILYIGDRIIR